MGLTNTRPRRPRRRSIILGVSLLVMTGGLTLAPTPAFAEESYSVLDRVPIELNAAPDAATGSAPAAAQSLPDPGATPGTTPGSTPGTIPPAPTTTTTSTTAPVEPPRHGAEVEGVEDFRMLSVQTDVAPSAPVQVRVHTPEGWQPWQALEFGADASPDPGSPEDARARQVADPAKVAEPVWVSHADGYEINAPGEVGHVEALLIRQRTHLVPQDATAPAGALTLPAQGQPGISSRASWGARPPKVTPSFAPTVRMAVVHHSVTTNDYSPGDVPGILQGIQTFHMDGRGWDDIGYNFAIDKFGRIWEARAGGITNAVVGAHAIGANYLGVGVVALGDFSLVPPTGAMIDAYGQLIGWKLYVHGTDAGGHAVFPLGAGALGPNPMDIDLPHIIGHRDVAQTACPGQYLYDQLGAIRSIAVAKQAALRTTPGFWGAVTWGQNADGRLEGFAVGNDQQLWHNWQTGGRWSGWYPLGGRVSGRPAVGNNADGRLEVFAVADGGAFVHAWQTSPNGVWSGLRSEGGTVSPSDGIAVGRNPDGRLEAFAVGNDDQVYNIWQVSPNSGWNGWASMGGSFPNNASLTAANNADGRLEVYGVGDGNVLVHAWKLGGGGWSAFTSMSLPVSGDPSVAADQDGRLEAVGIDPNGVMWLAFQTSPNGAWSPPLGLLAGFAPGAGAKIAPNADGRLQAFGRGAGGDLRTTWQRTAGSTWAPGFSLGGNLAGTPDVHLDAAGRLFAGAFGTPDLTRSWATGQWEPNTNWGPWAPMD